MESTKAVANNTRSALRQPPHARQLTVWSLTNYLIPMLVFLICKMGVVIKEHLSHWTPVRIKWWTAINVFDTLESPNKYYHSFFHTFFFPKQGLWRFISYITIRRKTKKKKKGNPVVKGHRCRGRVFYPSSSPI